MRSITLKKEQNNYNKCSAFAFSALLQLFFTSNFVVFVEGGARIFFAPGRRVPSYATETVHLDKCKLFQQNK